MNQSVHGGVGTREQQFTHLLPLRKKGYDIGVLCDLAKKMKSTVDDPHDGADPEENIRMPAGYTYFGQFVDHDLTFDNTSSLNPRDIATEGRMPTNLRTPRFDLDSIYGDGPDAQPFLYDTDGASLLYKHGATNRVAFTTPVNDQADQDLLRSPNGRAIIGDKRNDENVIVGQLQLLFVKYHNAVVQKLLKKDSTLSGTLLFEKARDQVRWTYQKLVLEDFLPRFVRGEVFADLAGAASVQERADRYAVYTSDKRSNLPREFVVAAYRFGHSAVRQGYRLNGSTDPRSIFAGSNQEDTTPTLLGFKPLPQALAIDAAAGDFERFFPPTNPEVTFNNANATKRVANDGGPLQFAYKIDTNIVDPLGVLPLNILPTSTTEGGAIKEIEETIAPRTLPVPKAPPTRPSLALLNLLRGNIYRVQSGQEIACVLRSKGLPQAETLPEDQLVVRVQVDETQANGKIYQFKHIDSALKTDTPLWFYILAESQAPIAQQFGIDKPFSENELLNGVGASTQLGWVGGRIVSEVFYGLMDSDDESFINAAPTGWKPMLGGDGTPIFLNLVKFVLENSPAPSTAEAPAEALDVVETAGQELTF